MISCLKYLLVTAVLALPFTVVDGAEPLQIIPNIPVTGSEFGGAIAIDGGGQVLAVAAASAIGPAGAVYLFRNIGGAWVEEQAITSQSPVAGDRYGRSIALFGDELIIGKPSSEVFDGVVDVYRHNGEQWTLVQSLHHPVFAFGFEVALSDSQLAVAYQGGVRVYGKTDTGWTFEQNVDGGFIVGSEFRSLNLDAGRLIIPGNNSVLVYRKIASEWQLEQTLVIPGLPVSARFGRVTALDGDNIFVSALEEEQRGAVYWFWYDGSSWIMSQRIPAFPTVSQGSYFGASLAIKDGLALIGAPLDKATGSAWIYRRCNDVWVPEQGMAVVAPNAIPFFGLAGALSDEMAFIGAPSFPLPFERRGAVFVYPNSADCDSDQAFDGCALAEGSASDCDRNLVLDHCQPATDCNENGNRDFCDLADQSSLDCNQSQVPDECEIATGVSQDTDGDGIPDECFVVACEDPAEPPKFSLVAVRVNGVAIPPTTIVSIRSGEILDTEILAMCWAPELIDAKVYQVSVDAKNTASLGAHGTVLPVGWNAPADFIPCPCLDPAYPICASAGCVAVDHDPNEGLFIDVDREDFIFAGLSPLTAIDMSNLSRLRFGGACFPGGAAIDDGFAKYGASLRLQSSSQACGTFEIRLLEDSESGQYCHGTFSFLGDSSPASTVFCASVESLTIRVCEDDGLFCNGLETCNAELGCQVTPPPSCDDGVACTVDACDESIDGCAHQPNHAACDDGDHCTRDACTPAGCEHIDDQCGDIPTTTHWGLAVLALCLLITAKLRYRRLA